jgi:general secretion pathway protein A
MYLNFHGFREKPFSLTPDPRFLFLSRNHREAFAHLLYGIDNRVGFIALTGEVGSGKTTVLRSLLSQLDADRYRTALIFNPCLSPSELLQSINRELGIPMNTSHPSTPLEDLNRFLLQQNAEGRTVVLVIDEAQNLEAPVLEQIRLISNLETDREKLIQIVLSGQPEFLQTLSRKEMRQLSQRITVRYHLHSMDFLDTIHYINHRLEVAGGRGGVLFSDRALRRIYRYSGGLPRLINVACDRALLVGYTKDAARIDSRIAATGIKDTRRNTAPRGWRRPLLLIPVFFILAALFVAGIYFKRVSLLDRLNPFRPIQPVEDQTKKDVVPTGEELSRAMAAELGNLTEPESIRRAFNLLATFWKVPPLPENSSLNQLQGVQRAAEERGLRLYEFSGNLGFLLRLGYPVVLELALPGLSEKRFLSLIGIKEEQLLVAPSIAGRESLSFSELERYWSGQGFLLWKDHLNLLPNLSEGTKGAHVEKLQVLLKEAGAYSKPLTGVYDNDTLSAVKEFQLSKGIEQDGIAGGQTLMVLYRSVDRFDVPKLTGGRK